MTIPNPAAVTTTDLISGKKSITQATGGLRTDFVLLDPNRNTSILVNKQGESAVVSVTNDAFNANIDDAAVEFSDVSTGTLDYLAGDSKGLTGMKIVSTPVTNPVEGRIIQYKEDR